MSSLTSTLQGGVQRIFFPTTSSPLDSKLEHIGIHPISPHIIRAKKQSLLCTALEKADVPFFWSAEIQDFIVNSAKTVTTAIGIFWCIAFAALLFFGGTSEVILSKIGSMSPVSITTIIVVLIVSGFTGYITKVIADHFQKIDVPYWENTPYEKFRETNQIPREASRNIGTVLHALPEAQFQIEHLTDTTCIFLWVTYKGTKKCIGHWE